MKNAWILDSSATYHVCFSLSNFASYNQIKLIIVKLPNGDFVIASQSSTVVFNDNFILKNVLYVPDFSFNLIFISQLTTSLKCELIFFSTECLIQNPITKDKIGTIDVEAAGLYVFNKMDRKIFNYTNKQRNIWHLRMGHPSEERLKILQTYYLDIKIDRNYICDACHQAKQRKLSFFHINTRTNQSFKLLHIDIWGPCFVISMLGVINFSLLLLMIILGVPGFFLCTISLKSGLILSILSIRGDKVGRVVRTVQRPVEKNARRVA